MKSAQIYAQEIRETHFELQKDPGSVKLEKQLSYRLKEWSARVPIIVRVAKNETKPWTEEELGISMFSMEKKVNTKFSQVGDYHFEVSLGDRVVTGGLVVERKEVSDLYGTLLNQNRRERFNREIERFRQDPRFDQMTIMVEGTMGEFLDYVPEVYVLRWDTVPGVGCKRLAEYLNQYYKLDDVKPEHVFRIRPDLVSVNSPSHTARIDFKSPSPPGLYIDGEFKDKLVVHSEYGKTTLYQAKGASRNSKLATIAKLETNDTHIQWCDSRELAIELYPFYIKQWLIRSYVKVLGIED
jgi:hypothetical protein